MLEAVVSFLLTWFFTLHLMLLLSTAVTVMLMEDREACVTAQRFLSQSYVAQLPSAEQFTVARHAADELKSF